MSLYLIFLTEDDLAGMTEEELAGLSENPPANGLANQATVNRLLRPLFVPSGIWADFNWVSQHYDRVLEWQETGFISGDIDIPVPETDDYPDLDSPRSTTWDTI